MKILYLFFVLLFLPFSVKAQVSFTGDALMGYLMPLIAIISPVYAKEDIWAGYPILRRICACESTGSPTSEPRQFNDDGSILWGKEKGKIVKRDVGACQINTKAHKKILKQMDLDVINSLEDNVEYAKILYDRNGVNDWRASISCWIK